MTGIADGGRLSPAADFETITVQQKIIPGGLRIIDPEFVWSLVVKPPLAHHGLAHSRADDRLAEIGLQGFEIFVTRQKTRLQILPESGGGH